MPFDEEVERRKLQGGTFGEDWLRITKASLAISATSIDESIQQYTGKPGYGQTIQALKSLRKELAKAYYTASVLEMLQRGGDFSHESIPEEEWVTA